jgi:uracil-DNA glycosylase
MSPQYPVFAPSFFLAVVRVYGLAGYFIAERTKGAARFRFNDCKPERCEMPRSMTAPVLRTAVEKAAEQPQTLRALNAVISASRPLVKGASRAVLGEGPVGAAIAFVGEQPGDQEDLQGRPFVGPAGQLLDRAMAEAGLDRRSVYVTNAVKHFKFEQRGKRRIHQKPTAGEVRHYRWWLDQELRLVHPSLVVALGATAVLALAGKSLPIARCRGPTDFNGRAGFITVHPSYVLRIPDKIAKEQGYRAFVSDLRSIRKLAASPTGQ